jgi:hypothetical protein
MCILEIERTLNNVVACLALSGSYPQPQNRRASSVLSLKSTCLYYYSTDNNYLRDDLSH